MKNLFRILTALAVILVAGPVQVSATLTEFPVGFTNLISYEVKYVDSVGVWVGLPDGYWFSTWWEDYTRPDGSTETINALARRSQEEFRAYLEKTLRDVADYTLAKYGGRIGDKKTFEVQLSVFTPGNSGMFFSLHKFSVGEDAGGLFVSNLEEAGRVSLEEIFFFTIAYPVFGAFAKAEVRVEMDGTVEVYSTDDGRKPPFNFVILEPTGISVSGWLIDPYPRGSSRSGSIRIWYTNGAEQVFDLSGGELLVTYLSPSVPSSTARRLGVPRVTDEGILLSFEATDDESVVIERSRDLVSWEPLYYHPASVSAARKAGESPALRVRSVRDTAQNGLGFYRATVLQP